MGVWVLFASPGLTQAIEPEKIPKSIQVDFNPDNGRSDARTPKSYHWPISKGPSSTFVLGAINAEIRSETFGKIGSGLDWGWWKGGYDYGATFSSDGATTQDPADELILELQGLSPGKHSVATWHNDWSDSSNPQAIEIELQVGSSKPSISKQVVPSRRVTHDDDCTTAFFDFEIRAEESAILRVRSKTLGRCAVLNGFAIDVLDPASCVRKPSPFNGDEHTMERPVLRWSHPANNHIKTKQFHVYLGDSLESVLHAKPGSVEYLGATSKTEWPTSAVEFMTDHFWRVDCEQEDGSILPGNVFRFRVRHDAFPGAEGYGRYAIGGRGGRVIHVTQLGDAGPGSLREAIEAEGARTVVFDVGGTIKLKSKLLIRNPYVTIAGQTAPGDGICVSGYTFGCFGTHDVVMRYVRLRVGDESGSTMDGTGFASSNHCIFDHCSVSWSIDEGVSSRGAKNITFQRSIVSEALNVANHKKYKAGAGHSFAGSISGDIGSFHHNLIAHCAGRNWSLAGGLNQSGRFAGRLDIRNNIVYNWQHRTNDGGVKALNLVNNLYIPGPASRVFHLLKPDVGSPEDPQQYFVDGNRVEGHWDEHKNPWDGAIQIDKSLIANIKLDSPFCDPLMETHSISQLEEEILRDVGANHAGLDAVDRRAVHDTRNRTATMKGGKTGLPGIIDSQADVGGWPPLDSGSPWVDQDRDGLPDDWELKNGLNPKQADQNQRLAPHRITALEVYLAELARPSMP